MIFILGFISGALALLLASYALDREPKTRKARRWTSITNARYETTFEHTFPGSFNPNDALEALGEIAAEHARRRADDGTRVEAGTYTVELKLLARFVGREGRS